MKRVLCTAFFFLAVSGGICIAGDDWNEAFRKLDKNNDRVLSFEEFSASEFYILEHEKKLPFASVKDLDKNGDGIVTGEELQRAFFDKIDTNKNGQIDLDEWSEYFTGKRKR